MSRYGNQYQIARPTGRCAATEQPIEPGMVYMATLSEDPEDEGFIRLDYSLEAWEAGSRPDQLFSYWKNTAPEPNSQAKPIVDDAVVLDIFERLAEDQRPPRIAFRFVLALILMRKRQLKFMGRSTQNDGEIWLMQPRGAPEDLPPIEVVNPHLADDDILEITAQLSEILQSEL